MVLPKRKRNRLPNFEYNTSGVYFITICTEKRKLLLWDNVGATSGRQQDVRLSQYGEFVERVILEIPKHYKFVALDHYVVMPNHIHLLLRIITENCGQSAVAPTVSKIIQQMKGIVTKQLGRNIWQKSFHDHVIRNEKDCQKIWEYIENNPAKWAEDCFYAEACTELVDTAEKVR